MHLGLYEWVYIITGMFGTYTVYKYMEVFFDVKRTGRLFEFLTYAVYYIFITFTYLLENVPIVLILSNLIAFFLLTFNYESTVKKRILSAVLTYLILMIIELTAYLLTGALNFYLFSENNYSSVYGMIVCRILSFLAVLVLGNFKNIRKGESVPNSNWICIVLIPLTSLYMNLMLFKADGLSVAQVLGGIILLFLVNFATFYLYDTITAALSEKMQSILILEQNKYYNKQLETMKTSLQATNTIKHDLKNHMFSIKTLIENGDTQGSLNYISKITDDIGTRKDLSTSGNAVIDSIINFKFQEAEQSGVTTSLDLRIPEDLAIPSFDMTIILGNLLDNAIKAAAAANDNTYVNVNMKYDKGRLMIQVDNSYIGEINEANGKLLTSNSDKENHGIGLQSVAKVIQKYNGTINIDYKDNIFSVSLLLYLE
jgi:Histidine kinase-, DNA gyrase B-, and HSP90-like ATPase.